MRDQHPPAAATGLAYCYAIREDFGEEFRWKTGHGYQRVDFTHPVNDALLELFNLIFELSPSRVVDSRQVRRDSTRLYISADLIESGIFLPRHLIPITL